MINNKKFFVKTHSNASILNTTEVWVDRETGVNYIVHSSGGMSGITPRLKADGTLMVTPLSDLRED